MSSFPSVELCFAHLQMLLDTMLYGTSDAPSHRFPQTTIHFWHVGHRGTVVRQLAVIARDDRLKVSQLPESADVASAVAYLDRHKSIHVLQKHTDDLCLIKPGPNFKHERPTPVNPTPEIFRTDARLQTYIPKWQSKSEVK